VHKQDDNRYYLGVAINNKLRNELDKIHEEQGNEIYSRTTRMILWMGIKHYYLFANSKAKRAKGSAMDIDKLTANTAEQDRQSDAGIYISKL